MPPDDFSHATAPMRDAESRGADFCLSAASFWAPLHVSGSAWREHAPFAFWLAGALRPSRFVELGTHGGFSYFCFCQALQRLELAASCYAIDTWRGDEHAGFYDEEVYKFVESWNDEHYAGFSNLIRQTFDDAAPYFQDGTVDLLHIDGRHFYEDVKHDWDVWKPKLSDRAVVLFHDTNVRANDFGVWRFWHEISTAFPSFEFVHGHGLGVLAVGAVMPPALRRFFEADPATCAGIRSAYASLGGSISARWRRQVAEADMVALQARLDAGAAAITGLRQEVAEAAMRADAAGQACAAARAQLDAAAARAEQAEASALEAAHAATRAQAEAVGRVQAAERHAAAAMARAEQQLADQAALLRENAAEQARLAERHVAYRAHTQTRLDQARNLAATLVTAQLAADAALAAQACAMAEGEQLLGSLRTRLAQMENSTIWRASRPLRLCGAALKSLLRGHHMRAEPVPSPPAPLGDADMPDAARALRDMSNCGLFDAEWYIRRYEDVAVAGADALLHYYEFGGAELRDPGPAFDAIHYVSQVLPGSLGGLPPLLHYVRHGRAAGMELRPAAPYSDQRPED